MLKKILLIVFVIFVTNIFAESKTDSDISNVVLLEKLNSNIELTKMFMKQNEIRLNLMEKNMEAQFKQIDKRFEQVDKRIDMVYTLSLWGFGIMTTFLVAVGGVLIRFSVTLSRVRNEIGAIKRVEKVEETIAILVAAIKDFRPEFSLEKFKKRVLTN